MNRVMENAEPFYRDIFSTILKLRDLTPAVASASSHQLSRSKRDSICYRSVVLFMKLACSSQTCPVLHRRVLYKYTSHQIHYVR